MTERAGVYCRISEDPRQQEQGVRRQREDCEALVRSRGWELVDTWTDNDVAVLRPGAERPGYSQLLAAAERGEITRIVAYGLSRIWRNRSERAQAIDRLSKLRVGIALVKGSDLDLSSAAGRMYAGMLGEFDTAESEIKAERVSRAALERAEAGKANGAVAYGWQRVKVRNPEGEVIDWRDEVDEAEAKVVGELVDRLLLGESIKALVGDLNAREIPGPRGGRWLSSTVRKVATRPANVGQRVRRGEIVGQAAWPAIVDCDRHDRVVALLTDPARTSSRSGARKHLLSYGIGACGVCDAELRVGTVGGNQLYLCIGKGCTGRRQARVDDLVEQVVVTRLSEPDARELLTRDDGTAHAARQRAEALRARLDSAADAFASGDIDRAQLTRITSSLRPELEEAEQATARAVRGVAPKLVAEMTGTEAATRWSALTVEQRRALLEALRMRVRLMPTRRGAGFVPEDVQIEWLGGAR